MRTKWPRRCVCANEGLDVFVLGGGSNILVSDDGFDGLVLQIAMRAHSDGETVTAGAGEEWDALVAKCVDDDLAGLECMSGIPGFVGGTPVQNVGAYGQEVAETITSCQMYDRETCEHRGACERRLRIHLPDEHLQHVAARSIHRARRDLQLESDGLRMSNTETSRYILQTRSHALRCAKSRDRHSPAEIDGHRRRAIRIREVRAHYSRIQSSTRDRLEEIEARTGDVPYFEFGDRVKGACRVADRECRLCERICARQRGHIVKSHARDHQPRRGTAADIIALKNVIQDGVRNAFGIELFPSRYLSGFESSGLLAIGHIIFSCSEGPMLTIKRLFSIVISTSLLLAIIPSETKVDAQDLVASDSIGGGSSVFVFHGSRKQPQARAGGGRVTVGGSGVGRVARARAGGQIATVAKQRRATYVAKRPKPTTTGANRKAALSNTLTAKADGFADSGQTDAAITNYRAALVQNPKNKHASDGLSTALISKGIDVAGTNANEAAVPIFEEAIKYDPQNDVAYAKLGEIHDAKGRKDAAVTNYEKALAINPSYTMLYSPLAMLYLDKGDVAKADSAIGKAAAAGVDTPDTRYVKGVLLFKENKNQEALAAFDNVLQADPNNADALYFRAQTLERLDRKDDANTAFQKAAVADPATRRSPSTRAWPRTTRAITPAPRSHTNKRSPPTLRIIRHTQILPAHIASRNAMPRRMPNTSLPPKA